MRARRGTPARNRRLTKDILICGRFSDAKPGLQNRDVKACRFWREMITKRGTRRRRRIPVVNVNVYEPTPRKYPLGELHATLDQVAKMTVKVQTQIAVNTILARRNAYSRHPPRHAWRDGAKKLAAWLGGFSDMNGSGVLTRSRKISGVDAGRGTNSGRVALTACVPEVRRCVATADVMVSMLGTAPNAIPPLKLAVMRFWGRRCGPACKLDRNCRAQYQRDVKRSLIAGRSLKPGLKTAAAACMKLSARGVLTLRMRGKSRRSRPATNDGLACAHQND